MTEHRPKVDELDEVFYSLVDVALGRATMPLEQILAVSALMMDWRLRQTDEAVVNIESAVTG